MRTSIGTFWRSTLASTLGLLAVTTSISMAARAEEPRYSIAIPAESLGVALIDLGRVTNSQILFIEEIVRSHQSRALSGELTTDDALQELLGGTGLVATRTRSGVWIIKPPSASTTESGLLKMAANGNFPPLAQASDVSALPPSQARPEPIAVSPDSIEEIVVTARRRRENLQAVPIAVTVLSGEQLVAQGVTDATSLANHVPSLVINSSNNGVMSKAFKVGIRGIQASSNLMFDDPPAGTYFAEGVVAHPYGYGDTMYDLQSVQVLKGPQGTLFGRNTTAGAILIEPNKASIDEGFNGNVKVTLGDYNLQQFNGMVNIPLNDVAALRIAGEHKKRDGYTTNILTGQKLDGVGNDSIRIGLLIKPTKNISSNTIIDYLDEDASTTSSEVIAVFGPNGGFGLGGALAASYANYNRILGEQQARGPWKVAEVAGTNGPFDMLSPTRCTAANPGAHCRAHSLPKETLSTGGVLNNTQIEFDNFTIKNIVGFRRMRHRDESNYNFPGGSPNGSLAPSGGGDADVRSKTSQWQEEFQLLGKAFENRLDWQAGLFMMREWGSEFTPAYTNSSNWSASIGDATNKSKGAFAQGTYALTDKLKGTLGVRKNWDHRDAKDESNATNSATGVVTCQIRVGATAAFLPISNCVMAGARDWQANTYTMALDYQLQDHTLLYVKHDRGYKSGGFSLRSHRVAQFAYDPEFVLNSEVGVKADWSLFDRPIRTNFALFNLDYTNQQLQVSNPGTNPVTTYVANVGKSKISGAEFEVTYKATKQLELSGYWSYSNPKYLSYSNTFAAGGPVVDLSGRPWALPRYQANLSAAYTLPLGSNVGTVMARADATFRSKSLVDNSVAGLLGTVGAPPTAGFTQVPQAGFGLLNLRLDWSHPMGNPVDLSMFVTNATNVAYIQGGTGVNGLVSANFAAPRMFGVELSYKFGEGFRPKD